MDGEIEPAELSSLLEGELPRIVDVRSPAEFRRAHIPHSENVPLARLVQDVERFDGTDRVVTVCPHGKASVKAARLISAYGGFDGRVESLRGGLEAWDGPLTDDSPGTGEADATDSGEGSAAPF